MAEQNTIAELREHLFGTIAALRDPDKPMDIDRAKAVSKVAETIIASAKVEVEAMRLTRSPQGTGFIPLSAPAEPAEPAVAASNTRGVTRQVTHVPGATITRNITR